MFELVDMPTKNQTYVCVTTGAHPLPSAMWLQAEEVRETGQDGLPQRCFHCLAQIFTVTIISFQKCLPFLGLTWVNHQHQNISR